MTISPRKKKFKKTAVPYGVWKRGFSRFSPVTGVRPFIRFLKTFRNRGYTSDAVISGFQKPNKRSDFRGFHSPMPTAVFLGCGNAWFSIIVDAQSDNEK
jgi:hypothetical protein